ncbi:helix-turn-helix transcriptional regulator [Paenibacillus sp. FSL H8-0034]|uniref:helix-turn-helix transcriptional regulator n=1 Tax=Paenibacillus sp. FSL H8-0034 TaxID=2954671 RepID=UPI0030F7074B
MSEMSYTVEEIARLLRISKVTVYDLIKKGDLVSYRVGKQMRVDAADLDAYKKREKGLSPNLQEEFTDRPADRSPSYPAVAAANGMRTIVITGQDISIDILARHIEKNVAGMRPLRAYVGSLDSLISLYRGECDVVSTHLLDGETGEYNLPYIRRIFTGSSYLVVNLLSRPCGFLVAQGNPLDLHGWKDLKRPGLRLVNREKGVGARVLLDAQLSLHGIQSERLIGYDQEESNPIGVAAKVASGEADIGIGNEKTAAMMDNVDFVKLIEERVDLVMLKKPHNREWIQALLQILNSEAFLNELRVIPGTDISQTGTVMLET